ncbi:MAG: tetratricopeptide repeat protein, partial [Proteobacteria bacterium]|nr:tetratricopeptide repeat protein [Pseudomonadota bacterium]
MAEQIFISYRRSDAGGHAGRLHDRLSQWFDAGVVFYDLDAIEAGAVFPVRLAEALDAAVVVLVLIGPDWVTELNRRAGAAEVDFVRHEVERALARRAAAGRPCVIPVLFGGATAPAVTALEAPLRAALAPLCELDMHAFHGKNADWNNQFVRLRALIAAAPGVPVPRWRAPDGVDRPFHLIGNRLSPHFHDPTGLLERLHDSLSASGRTAVLAPAAIYGMGGVGKTQLALKYSHSYRDQYAGVWWLRAQTPEGLQLDAQACCQAAGAPLPDRVAPTQALNAWLQRQEHAWLLVYDNAESLESLHEHLPEAGPHHVLITSRDPAWGSLAAPLQAGTWTGEQGADFLIERCGPIAARDHRDVWQALADALGGLPLALEQAAGYLEATAMQAGEYLELLGAARHSAALLDYGRIATGYEASVGATLALAFERLRPATRQLLGLLAWCAPEPVPERLFVGGADLLSGELAEAASDVIAWNDVVQELRRYGIADRVVGAAPALQLHRLTLNVARHRSIGAEREVRTLTALLGKLLPRAPESPVHWPLYARLLPHVQQLAEREFAPEGLAEPVELLLYVAQYLRAGPALYAQSRRIEERLVAMCREKLGEEHADTLTSINNLAVTLSAQGDLAAARALQESVLEVRRRVLGEEH